MNTRNTYLPLIITSEWWRPHFSKGYFFALGRILKWNFLYPFFELFSFVIFAMYVPNISHMCPVIYVFRQVWTTLKWLHKYVLILHIQFSMVVKTLRRKRNTIYCRVSSDGLMLHSHCGSMQKMWNWTVIISNRRRTVNSASTGVKCRLLCLQTNKMLN